MSANKHKIEFKCSVLLNLHMWKRPEFPVIMAEGESSSFPTLIDECSPGSGLFMYQTPWKAV